MRSPLTGRVNVYNLLAASCAALARGLTLEEIVAGAAAGAQVPGRFEVVPSAMRDLRWWWTMRIRMMLCGI